jgi:hypothetical protein
MSIFQKSCSPEETSSLVCIANDRAEHIQHGESGFTTAEKLPQRWTGGPGFRKKRNLAEEPA